MLTFIAEHSREEASALVRPAGETLTYGGLAAKLGCPRSVRAVGLANGANPISVVVPCHRVIGSDGTLTGYGGGLERKEWLLAHERCEPMGQLSLLTETRRRS